MCYKCEAGWREEHKFKTSTPMLPWKLSSVDIKNAKGRTVALRPSATLGGEINQECQDAALIVRAVNNHEELLFSLRFLIHAVKNGSYADIEIAIRKSDQAIAKAEGK